MRQRVNTSRKPNPENSPADQSGSRHRTIQPTVPLPEVIHQNIKTAVELHARHEEDVPRHQRSAEAVTAFFGRLVFPYSILLVIVLWVTPNFLPRRFGIARFDPPPFSKLQFSLTVGSLLTTAGVLMKQNRQEKLVQKRAQLSLQLNLLSEQKIRKLIALVEDLRRDLPNAESRDDPEAEMMKEFADPYEVVVALEETLTQELEASKSGKFPTN